jgi:hypothetical protein
MLSGEAVSSRANRYDPAFTQNVPTKLIAQESCPQTPAQANAEHRNPVRKRLPRQMQVQILSGIESAMCDTDQLLSYLEFR